MACHVTGPLVTACRRTHLTSLYPEDRELPRAGPPGQKGRRLRFKPVSGSGGASATNNRIRRNGVIDRCSAVALFAEAPDSFEKIAFLPAEDSVPFIQM